MGVGPVFDREQIARVRAEALREVTDALEGLLTRLEKSGELPRVKLIYTVDYFQNPTGLTLSLARRRHMLELELPLPRPSIALRRSHRAAPVAAAVPEPPRPRRRGLGRRTAKGQ